MSACCQIPSPGTTVASQLLVAERDCREAGAAGVHVGACVCRGQNHPVMVQLCYCLSLLLANQAGVSSAIHWRHWRWGFLGSTEQVFQIPGAHSCMQSMQTGKRFLLPFIESVCVLSCVRPVALIFQHDLFSFQCLGAALAEQMNQIKLLNQPRASAISRYYLLAWS